MTLRDSNNYEDIHIVPVTFKQACGFVQSLHRHHKPPIGHKFSIGVADSEGKLRGVAMIGRPVARHFDDGITAEVIRTCTDGTKNCNSMLYGAAWRAAKAMGYKRIITYTQEGESGSSLKAAGWIEVKHLLPRKGWDTPTRRRTGNGNDDVARILWEKTG